MRSYQRQYSGGLLICCRRVPTYTQCAYTLYELLQPSDRGVRRKIKKINSLVQRERIAERENRQRVVEKIYHD